MAVKCNGYVTVLKLFCNCSALFSSIFLFFFLSYGGRGGSTPADRKRGINGSILDKVVA